MGYLKGRAKKNGAKRGRVTRPIIHASPPDVMINLSAKSLDVKSEKNLKQEIKKLTEHKRGAMTLAYTYEKTDLPWRVQWADMLRYCGRKLIYVEDPDAGGWRIAAAMFCQKRLCPLCSWRRTIRTGRNVHQIVTSPEFKDVQFIFLTLTIRNCTGEELPETLDRLLSAWNGLTSNKRQPFRKSFLGTLRSIEITYNRRAKTYHPHVHVLAAVSPGYFKKSNPDYISHETLREVWGDALNRAIRILPAGSDITSLGQDIFGSRLDLGPMVRTDKKIIREKYTPIDYAPQVRIEKIKNSTGKVIAEIAKYTVKPGDYIDLPEVVQVLDPVLRRRRLIAYGGLFADVQKRLKLDDEQIAEVDYPKVTLQELLNNPLVRKIVTEWTFQGTYKITPYEEK
jgi:plasmid rolling circle replication initiator protein Rep